VSWPRTFVAVGEDGCGNYYFTDTRIERPAVFLADHEDHFSPDAISELTHYDTFASFVSFLREVDAEVKADKAQAEERRKNKQWWQFWIR
jgi:hypothetical protein